MQIAVLPARSGSKRIKNKNIKNFLGKPIISYTITKLKKSNLFDEIYVSTDSKKIAQIVQKYGAKVPFLRNKLFAGDKVSTLDVVKNFVSNSYFLDKKINIVCCIYPCTPLLDIKDLKKGIRIFHEQRKSFVYPCLRYKHPILRSFSLNKNKTIQYLFPKFENKRTQDIKTYYHDAGQFYISNIHNWKNKKKIHTDATSFEINNFNAIDIDDLEDWKLAEIIFKNK